MNVAQKWIWMTIATLLGFVLLWSAAGWMAPVGVMALIWSHNLEFDHHRRGR